MSNEICCKFMDHTAIQEIYWGTVAWVVYMTTTLDMLFQLYPTYCSNS